MAAPRAHESKAITAKTPNADALLAVLDSGYKRRQKAWRSIPNAKTGKWETVGFDVFGFKIIAGTRFISEELARRCIKIPMTRNRRKVKRTVNTTDALKLRGKLAQWRVDNLGSDSSVVSVLLEGIYTLVSPQNNRGAYSLEITDGTILEVYSPLVYTTGKNATNAKNATIATANTVKLYAYMFEQQWEKHAAETTSFDADIVRAVVNIKALVKDGKFQTRDVANLFNQGKPEEDQWKVRSVGHHLGKLSFVNAVMPDHTRGWYWNERLIRRLCERYDIEFKDKEASEEEGRQPADFQQISNQTFAGSVLFNLRSSPAFPNYASVNEPKSEPEQKTLGRTTYSCNVCPCVFSTMADLEYHMATHRGRGGEE